MSAVVCSKRSSSIFGDDLVPFPSSPPSPSYHHHHHPAKRARCSPTRRSEVLLHHLFPDMDPQLLEKALEASGDDLDSAIKRLNELRLESAGVVLAATVCESEKDIPSALNLLCEGTTSNGHLDVATENPPATDNSHTSHHSFEWVDLFVKEMMSSSNIDDARARASRALVEFEKSIMNRVGAEAVQNLHRENVMLKEQLAIILRENAVLKWGVAIQHERQKEFDVRT